MKGGRGDFIPLSEIPCSPLCQRGQEEMTVNRIPAGACPRIFLSGAGMTGVTRTLTMMFLGFRSRSGPFEGPASVRPPALPEDIYFAFPRLNNNLKIFNFSYWLKMNLPILRRIFLALTPTPYFHYIISHNLDGRPRVRSYNKAVIFCRSHVE